MQNIIRNVFDKVRSQFLSHDKSDTLYTTGGKMTDNYQIHTGTFTKRNGQTRTMSFIKEADVPTTVRGTGTGPRLSKGEEVVYDINARGFRVFNWNTTQGQVSQKNMNFSFDKS